MGIKFSKLMGSTARSTAPDEVTRSPGSLPPIQSDIPASLAPTQDGSSSRQALVIRYTTPNYLTSGSRIDMSPSNTNYGGGEHDESTVYENGGSSNSPRSNIKVSQSSQTRAFSFDSSFPNFHPETKKEVFRRGSVGDMCGVQIVCDQLLEVLKHTVVTPQLVQDEETIISRDSLILEPYELIIRNKVRIADYRREIKDESTKKHLDMLLEYLESSQPGLWQKFDEVQTQKCQKISFKNLPLLYPSRTTVFTIDGDAWRAYIIEKSEVVVDMKTTSLRVHAWFLDFNMTGGNLIPYRATFEIPSFSSEKSIEDLNLIPERFLDSTDSPRQELVDRGLKHWSYCKTPSYKEYKGKAWRQVPYNTRLMVIVDYSTSSRCVLPDDGMNQRDGTSRCSVCIGKSLGLLSFSDPLEVPTDSHVCINNTMTTEFQFEDCWTDSKSALLFCPPRMWAFSLRFKTWNLISHDDLHDIEPQDASFEEELYMDEVRKNSLSGIVSAYLNSMGSNSGTHSPTRKHQGLNILLIGSPGTGKTFTAECLSRKFGVALYTVTCGDLGVDANMLDLRLQETLTRAANWSAMVLLDDVDLYGCHRIGYSHERSALLPTFLRHLEYSECLTFISMISQEEGDPAFPSRIHLSVLFLEFEFITQQRIWTRMIRSLPQDSASINKLCNFIQGDLFTLNNGEHRSMNARQIRNCMDVALVLAQNDGSGTIVTPYHIQTVLALGRDFGAYVRQDTGILSNFP